MMAKPRARVWENVAGKCRRTSSSARSRDKYSCLELSADDVTCDESELNGCDFGDCVLSGGLAKNKCFAIGEHGAKQSIEPEQDEEDPESSPCGWSEVLEFCKSPSSHVDASTSCGSPLSARPVSRIGGNCCSLVDAGSASRPDDDVFKFDSKPREALWLRTRSVCERPRRDSHGRTGFDIAAADTAIPSKFVMGDKEMRHHSAPSLLFSTKDQVVRRKSFEDPHVTAVPSYNESVRRRCQCQDDVVVRQMEALSAITGLKIQNSCPEEKQDSISDSSHSYREEEADKISDWELTSPFFEHFLNGFADEKEEEKSRFDWLVTGMRNRGDLDRDEAGNHAVFKFSANSTSPSPSPSPSFIQKRKAFAASRGSIFGTPRLSEYLNVWTVVSLFLLLLVCWKG